MVAGKPEPVKRDGPTALQSLLRFMQVGVGIFALNLGTTAFVHEVLAAPEELAYATALVLVFTVNFFVSRHYVYEAADGDARGQAVRFLASQGVIRILEYGTFLGLHTGLGFQYLWTVFSIQVGAFLVKFTVFRFFVFRRPRLERVEPAKSRCP